MWAKVKMEVAFLSCWGNVLLVVAKQWLLFHGFFGHVVLSGLLDRNLLVPACKEGVVKTQFVQFSSCSVS